MAMTASQPKIRPPKPWRWFGLCVLLLFPSWNCFGTLWGYECRKNEDCEIYQHHCVQGVCRPKQVFDQRDNILYDRNRRVDILFVIHNSPTMRKRLKSLNIRVLRAFIQRLFFEHLDDIQIAVVTSNMNDPNQRGRYQHHPELPAVISSKNFQYDDQRMAEALQRNIQVRLKEETKFDRSIEAMMEALKGHALARNTSDCRERNSADCVLRRENSTLAVLFFSDQEDCSHQGRIQEKNNPPDVCRFPPQIEVTDIYREAIKNAKGRLQELLPVKQAVSFLQKIRKEAGHRILISGLIGKTNLNTINPDNDVCHFDDNEDEYCGGCLLSSIGPVFPGLRVAQLSKAFINDYQSREKSQCFAICEEDRFDRALNAVVHRIHAASRQLPLSQIPALNNLHLPSLKVRYVIENYAGIPAIDPASEHIRAGKPVTCTNDAECDLKLAPNSIKPHYICGRLHPNHAKGVCFKDGWVYLYPNPQEGLPARIALSGSAYHALHQVKFGHLVVDYKVNNTPTNQTSP